jgi:RNA polymerase sigma-70 factor (ECF subfamily)
MDRGEQSDGILIRGYLEGDESAFECLYERYRRQLYSYLNKMLPGNTATVDDLYQQTWLRVLENLGRYEEQQKFLSWAFRIAHNLAIDHFRRDRQRQQVELDPRLPARTVVPWTEMDRETRRQVLEDTLDELTPEQKEVFLFRREGMQFKDIAVVQNCSINTVLGRMHYAMKKLRRLLDTWE